MNTKGSENMIERILKFSLTHRALVVLVVAGVAAIGLYNLRNLH